ncbi:M-phase phosphoprotein [Pontoporia blainvillei]|uniref:M-phase phosphoprotein n=1 Tax=Pontoporia blainvillei TaxID=48723 RepID=A0ABX0S5H4_PONBL|nr:M-phase phosphoprotein [Pontoporia blainvillei]
MEKDVSVEVKLNRFAVHQKLTQTWKSAALGCSRRVTQQPPHGASSLAGGQDQRLPLNNDIFEANSDSDQQSETKEDTSSKKKKKKLRQKEEKSPDDLKKKKAKTGKLKDKPKPDLEGSSESMVFDLRTKKRILEAKEELKESKKPKKDDIRETKELKKVIKKGEIRDLKTKKREDSKENRKTKKEKCVESQVDSELSVLSDSPFQDEDSEDLHSDNRNEKQPIKGAKDKAEPEAIQDTVSDQLQDGTVSADEDDVKAKRKKKKPRRTEELRGSKKLENKSLLEKKNTQKKQRNPDKGPSSAELDKPMAASAPAQKSSRPSVEERGSRRADSSGEVSAEVSTGAGWRGRVEGMALSD